MAIGFAKTSNLFESQSAGSATSIFNNLAGEGISSDIALFAENLTTVTEVNYETAQYKASAEAFLAPDEVYYSSGDASGFTYIVIPADQFAHVPFTDNTVIFTLANNGDKVYHVVGDSNGIDRFRLYAWDNTTKTKGALRTWNDFYQLATKKFYRPDPVTFANMTNYSKDRLMMNDDSTSLLNPYTLSEDRDIEDRDRSQQISFLDTMDIPEITAETDLAIDSLAYKESRNLLSYKKNNLNRLLSVNAPIQIANDAGLVEGSTATSETMPGLYIVAGGISARAFSDTTNPWIVGTEDVSSYDTDDTVLATESFIKTASASQTAVVNKLVFQGPNPHIITTNTSGVRATDGTKTVSTTWTHKARVEINGEQYYLLLTDQESTFS